MVKVVELALWQNILCSVEKDRPASLRERGIAELFEPVILFPLILSFPLYALTEFSIPVKDKEGTTKSVLNHFKLSIVELFREFNLLEDLCG